RVGKYISVLSGTVGNVGAAALHEGDGLGASHAIHVQPVAGLDGAHGLLGERAVVAVHAQLADALEGGQGALEGLGPVQPGAGNLTPIAVHQKAGIAVLVLGRLVVLHAALGHRPVVAIDDAVVEAAALQYALDRLGGCSTLAGGASATVGALANRVLLLLRHVRQARVAVDVLLRTVPDLADLTNARVGRAGLAEGGGPALTGLVGAPGGHVVAVILAEVALHAQAVPGQATGVARGGDPVRGAEVVHRVGEYLRSVLHLRVGELHRPTLVLVLDRDGAAIGVQVRIRLAGHQLVLTDLAPRRVVEVSVGAARPLAGAIHVRAVAPGGVQSNPVHAVPQKRATPDRVPDGARQPAIRLCHYSSPPNSSFSSSTDSSTSASRSSSRREY